MSDDRELEDLTNLTKHPGWLRFAATVSKEWQDNINTKLAWALSHKDDAEVASNLRLVVFSKGAIDRMLRWPEERIAALQRKQSAQAPTIEHFNRGGQ